MKIKSALTKLPIDVAGEREGVPFNRFPSDDF